jgi:hypothetical protein
MDRRALYFTIDFTIQSGCASRMPAVPDGKQFAEFKQSIRAPLIAFDEKLQACGPPVS